MPGKAVSFRSSLVVFNAAIAVCVGLGQQYLSQFKGLDDTLMSAVARQAFYWPGLALAR
jgi:hypothetical protein